MPLVLIPWMTGGPELYQLNLPVMSFDVAMAESHKRTVKITDHPVEVGSPISDHIEDQPDEVTLRVMFSDAPPNDPASFPDRARRMYGELVRLMQSHDTFQLVTGLDLYEDMAIESITVKRTSKTGYVVEADVSFRQLRIAQQLAVTIPTKILSDAASKKGQGTTDVGQQGTNEASDAQEEDAGSVAIRIGY